MKELILLQFLSKLYQGDQILRLYIYKLCFEFCISPPKGNVLFFYSCMAAWVNKFLVVWFDISHILSGTVAYLHIIPIENFMELLRRWKMQICQLKELICNVRNDFTTIRRVKPYDVTVVLSFYVSHNKELINSSNHHEQPCNCRKKKKNCPLEG